MTTKATKVTVTCIEKTGTSNYGHNRKESNNIYINGKLNNDDKTKHSNGNE